jgi:hypothetical protein
MVCDKHSVVALSIRSTVLPKENTEVELTEGSGIQTTWNSMSGELSHETKR